MNTLIAILGDTYERIIDKKDQYAIMVRTKIYYDHINYIKLSEKMTEKEFLFLVRPCDDEEGEVWVSAIHQLKQKITRS